MYVKNHNYDVESQKKTEMYNIKIDIIYLGTYLYNYIIFIYLYR